MEESEFYLKPSAEASPEDVPIKRGRGRPKHVYTKPALRAKPAKELALKDQIKALCLKMDYDPVTELIKLVKQADSELTPQDRIRIHTELAQYCAPKLKAVDINANVGGDIQINIVRYGSGEKIPLAQSDEKVLDIERAVAPALDQTVEAMQREAIIEAVTDDERESPEIA